MIQSEKSRQPTENSLLLTIFDIWRVSNHCSEVEIIDPFLVCHQEFAPPLLASLALHFILINTLRGIEIWEIGLEMCVDLIVDLGEPQGRATDLFEDCPVCGHMLNN